MFGKWSSVLPQITKWWIKTNLERKNSLGIQVYYILQPRERKILRNERKKVTASWCARKSRKLAVLHGASSHGINQNLFIYRPTWKPKSMSKICKCSQVYDLNVKVEYEKMDTYKYNFVDSGLFIFPFAGWNNLIYFPHSLQNIERPFRRLNKNHMMRKSNFYTFACMNDSYSYYIYPAIYPYYFYSFIEEESLALSMMPQWNLNSTPKLQQEKRFTFQKQINEKIN